MLDCLNGCYDRDYGESERSRKICVCTAEETLAAVDRLTGRGLKVVFEPAPARPKSHTHRDSRVEPGDSCRLNSCCPACDLVADGVAEYGDFLFLGPAHYGPRTNRVADRIDSTHVGTPSVQRSQWRRR